MGDNNKRQQHHDHLPHSRATSALPAFKLMWLPQSCKSCVIITLISQGRRLGPEGKHPLWYLAEQSLNQ